MEVARGGWRHPGNEARWGRTRFLRVFASGPVAYWQFSALHALLTAVPSPSHQLPAVLRVGPGAAGLLAQLPPDTRSCGSSGSLCLSQDGGARLACPSPARLLTLASSGAGSQLSLMSHGSGSSHKCPYIPPAWWGHRPASRLGRSLPPPRAWPGWGRRSPPCLGQGDQEAPLFPRWPQETIPKRPQSELSTVYPWPSDYMFCVITKSNYPYLPA